MSEPRPIFIIGAPGSGTTLLRLMIDSHPHLSCGPETHFLGEFERVTKQYQWRIELFGYTAADWHQRVAALFDDYHRQYASRRGKRRWADKTPSYSLRLPFINALFPQAQFLHLIRDGHDVVASSLDRWGYNSALGMAWNDWHRHVEASRRFGRSVDSSRYREIRYEQLARDPESTIRDVLEFLDEPWDPMVLEFNRVPHDGKKHGHAARRRQESGDPSLIYTSRIGVGRGELDPLLRAVLYLKSRPLLKELGYLEVTQPVPDS